MIKEDFCSYEVAKLLKEKGFNGACRSYYTDNIDYIDFSYCINELTDLQMGVWEILRPTHQMAMAWLKENHQIFIRPNIIFAVCPVKYYCEILCYGDNLQTQQDVNTEDFETPEEAVEAALKYSLENLI